MMVNLYEALAKVKHGVTSSPELQLDEDTRVANLTYQQGVRAFAQKNYEGALDFLLLR
ncbi:hypothetical protein ACTHEE_004629 [Vibrio parahaemolyticus]